MRHVDVVLFVCGLGLVGCFKPALEQEVVDDSVGSDTEADSGESDAVDTEGPDTPTPHPDTSEVAETPQPDAPEVVDLDDSSQPDVDRTSCAGRPNGDPCDDGGACTRDDRCASLGGEGIPFTCDDGLTCTEDRCDGAGGCTYSLALNRCIIEGGCVEAGELSPTGCSLCTATGTQPAQERAPCVPVESCRADGACSVGSTPTRASNALNDSDSQVVPQPLGPGPATLLRGRGIPRGMRANQIPLHNLRLECTTCPAASTAARKTCPRPSK